MDGIMDAVDDDIKNTLGNMRLVSVYNKLTGANLTHTDVAEWGIIEEAKIMAALDLWDIS